MSQSALLALRHRIGILCRVLTVRPAGGLAALARSTPVRKPARACRGNFKVLCATNFQPVGAFEVRGGLALLAGMTPDERRGRSPTLRAPRPVPRLRLPPPQRAVYTVVMPNSASELKSQAVRALGGLVVLHRENMADAGLLH